MELGLLSVVAVGQQPHGVAVDSANRRVYVANHRSNTITVLDADTLQLLESIDLTDAIGPNGVAVNSADQNIFVAAKFTNDLTAFSGTDPLTRSTLWRSRTGSQPDGVALHSDLPLAYVANFGDNSLTAVRLTDGETLTVPAGGQPSFPYWDDVSQRLFVTNHLDGTVSVFDWEGKLLQTLPTGLGSYGIDFDAQRRLLYVANIDAKNVTVFTVDEKAEEIERLGAVELFCRPWNVRANDENGHLFVVCPDEEKVHIYYGDDYSYRWVGWLPTGKKPGEGMAFDPVTRRIFVTNGGDDSLTVLSDGGPVLAPVPTPVSVPEPTVPPVCPAVSDGHEPNDSTASATALQMDRLQADATFHTPGDADWYRIDLPAGPADRRFTFRAESEDPELLIRMEIFDSSGTGLVEVGFGEVTFDPSAQAQTGYLRVSNASGYADCRSSYALTGSAGTVPAHSLYLPALMGDGSASQQAQQPADALAIRRLAGGRAEFSIESLAVDSRGHLYTAGEGQLQGFDAQGLLLFQAPSGQRPRQILAQGTNLLVANWGADPMGGWVGVRTDAQATTADLRNSPNGTVELRDANSGALRGAIPNLRRPSGLALTSAGLWIAETGGDRLLLADPATGQIRRELALDGAPYVLRGGPDGVFVTLPGKNSAAFVDSNGAVRWQTELDGLGLPQDMTYDSRSNRLYVLYLLSPRYGQVAVLDGGSGAIVDKIEPTLSRPLRGAYALALDARGHLLVSTAHGTEQFALLDLQPKGLLAGGFSAGPFNFAVAQQAEVSQLWSLDRRLPTAQPVGIELNR